LPQDAEFEQTYQEALKIVTPLALMSREDQFMNRSRSFRADLFRP